jgi:sulfoxide reductase catalytic subunit YedY
MGGLSAGLWIAGCGRAGSTAAPAIGPPPKDVTGRYPADRNGTYALDRPLTDESVAGRYNNFYEFTSDKESVIGLSRDFRMRPWSLEVTGLVARPAVYDVDDLVRKMPLDERLYRHRCVEAWAMAVPWTGFPLSALIRKSEPLPDARYVRFVTFSKPEQPGMKRMKYVPWPYHEGLTLPEAMNDLTILATGIYGHPLPPQHGGPIRLVVPWKYGFKSIKSIVRIELTSTQPATLWNTLEPREYDFVANVNPAIPHPRWSQKTERMLGTEKKRPTIIYNGYGRYVGDLYKS